MAKQSLGIYFELFIEIGIIQQLSRALLDSRLPEGFLQSHFSVLNHLLQGRDGSTPLQIAKAFQVPKTTMTHTLSGLQKHGLITIQPNPIQKMVAASACGSPLQQAKSFAINQLRN